MRDDGGEEVKQFALAGNPNCGKTTLFNLLTGSTAYVGNWPGVTVDKKVGTYKKGAEPVQIVDLPGIYSLSPYTPEESHLPQLHSRGKARLRHQYRGRDQPRAQPLSDHAAHGDRRPHGHRPQHDGRGGKIGRRHRRKAPREKRSGCPSSPSPRSRGRASRS